MSAMPTILVRFWGVMVLLLLAMLSLDTFHWGRNSEVQLTLPWSDLPSHDIIPSACPPDVAVVSAMWTDDYLEGILTLGFSLKRNAICGTMVLMFFEGAISRGALAKAARVGWVPRAVDRIPAPVEGHYHFRDNFAKLRIWEMEEFSSILYIDGDCLVRLPINELFHLQVEFAAVGDTRNDVLPWGDHGVELGFNAGVILVHPSQRVFDGMMEKITRVDEYDVRFSEQGFLNMFYLHRYTRLPLKFNANMHLLQGWPDLWWSLWPQIAVVHFTTGKIMVEGGTGDLRVDQALDREPFRSYDQMRKQMYESLS